MKNKTILNKIKKIAEYQMKIVQIKDTLQELELFDGCCYWDVDCIHYNCKIKDDGYLYTQNDVLLSRDGLCMDEPVPYFVNQYCGYHEDNFYGTMFIKVDDDNTFVAVRYEC